MGVYVERCRSSWPGRWPGAGEPNGSTVVVEVCDSTLFESLGGGVEEAHACEVVACLAVGQYVYQTEEISTDSPGGRHDGGKEEKVALVVVVLLVVKLRFDCRIDGSVGVGV